MLVRTRGNYGPRTSVRLVMPLGLIDPTYGVAILRAIARRVEALEPAVPRPRIERRAEVEDVSAGAHADPPAPRGRRGCCAGWARWLPEIGVRLTAPA